MALCDPEYSVETKKVWAVSSLNPRGGQVTGLGGLGDNIMEYEAWGANKGGRD